MKTQTIIFALATVIFAAPALADHNKTSWLFWKEGHWTEVTEDGDVFEGHYVNGERLGPWSARFAVGFVVECLYVKDKDCNWVIRYADGGVEEGPLVDGKKHGHWVLRWADGDVHEGPYVGGKRHGHWVLRGANGGVEEGPFVDGKRHGHWVLRLADGSVVEGPFVDDKRHGNWVVRYPDGTVKHKTWRNGKRIN